MEGFHSLTKQWFQETFREATPPQRQGWPALQRNQHTLIAAPTGTGKTMAAFLVAIDRLIVQSLAGDLPDELQVIYVSPLRALSNDVSINLEKPIAEIKELAKHQYKKQIDIRVGLRTSDTTASERSRLLRKPPHILVTTPESLYLLLTSQKGRDLLKPTTTLIIDEIHALARDKRGSHLSLSMVRLSQLTNKPIVRVGLSATMKPLKQMAEFLCGVEQCHIVDASTPRKLDLKVELPKTPLSAICSHEQWAEIHKLLSERVKEHRSTLIFVNTRRMAERVTFHLSEILGEGAVMSHHGSLSKNARLSAEQKLKSGALKAIVATASLELGIDVGYVDLVCQVGSPRSISIFLQRIGRSGHALGLVPKGRLFALTRDELLECYALIQSAHQGILDQIEIPIAPLDILAQHIVSMCTHEDWNVDELFTLICQSWTYHNLDRKSFDQVIDILTHGIGRGTKKGSYLHFDQVNGQVRARRHARLAALTSGGAIPEQNLFRVVTAENQTFIGTLDEDFAIESSRGDIFLLGNTSWRVEAVRNGQVVVHDAGGAPPTIPFWFGEAPGRTYELSEQLSKLREQIQERLPSLNAEDPNWNTDSETLPKEWALAARYLQEECHAESWGIKQALCYCASQVLAVGFLPTHHKVLFERFFDDTGGMQLVVHSPYGARVNRAWGLAFRKRFCRGFDFELQASADDNGIVLSVGPNQSFAIDSLYPMLNSKNCKDILVQALLDAPMFGVRWRWNITRALAVLRFRNGKKVPPHLQRYQSDDLLTTVFPEQTQCFEHRTGDLEVPDHPYVLQTVTDCLTEAMDIERFTKLMVDKDEGVIALESIDSREPSPFSYELIHANPYAFLDNAPLEERRTRAVFTRKTLDPKELKDLGFLDQEAIALVRKEAWPTVRDPDELHDAIYQSIVLPIVDIKPWSSYLDSLLSSHRAYRFKVETTEYVCCAEHLVAIKQVYPKQAHIPEDKLPEKLKEPVDSGATILKILQGQLEIRGPKTSLDLAQILNLEQHQVEAYLAQLELQGAILSGFFTQSSEQLEWCDRRLLNRIHRLTVAGLRDRIKPVSIEKFLSFLVSHQGINSAAEQNGDKDLYHIIQRLSGFEAPCGAWEDEIFTLRMRSYDSKTLDQLCLQGAISWGRIKPAKRADHQKGKAGHLSRLMPLSIVPRPHLSWVTPLDRQIQEDQLSGTALDIYKLLRQLGAPFFDELLSQAKLPKSMLEDVLAELVSLGFVTADSFGAIRPLIAPDRKRRQAQSKRSRRKVIFETSFESGGRWSIFLNNIQLDEESHRLESWAWLLLERYGVVFKDLLERERLMPKWRDLLPVYRTLEMRGEIRGGRFVENMHGEQYALPEAVENMRKEQSHASPWIVASACDPLNISFLIQSIPKIPAIPGNRIVIENGKIIAYREAGNCTIIKECSLEEKEAISRAIRLNGSFRYRDPFLQEYYQQTTSKKQLDSKKVINLKDYKSNSNPT